MDRGFFIAEIETCSDMMYRVAWSILRNEADVQDALQDAVLKAWEKRDKLREEKYFRTWMTRILINVCYDTQRMHRKIVESCAFLHFRSDQQAFAFDLSHFRFDVPAAADSQGVCGYISAVESQHAGDGIPEGGFAVTSIAVCDDERLHKNFPDSSKAADHLYIVDKLLIFLKNQIQIILPELRSFTSG